VSDSASAVLAGLRSLLLTCFAVRKHLFKMTEKIRPDHIGDSSSDRSPSFHEKVNLKDDPLGVLHTVPDPDEGLSEEERRKLVCIGEASALFTSLTSGTG